jgi:hypothetical protein
VKVRTGLNIRKAFNCAVTAAVVTLLAISLVFDKEVSDLINQKMNKKTPIAEKSHLRFPMAFLDMSGGATVAGAPAKTETRSFAPEAPKTPEIEVADPGVLSSEEKP